MSDTETTLTATDPRAVFARAYATAGSVMGAVHPEQFARPTPCDEFDVEALLGHLLAVGRRVACLGRGEDPFSVPEVIGDIAADGWAAAWQAAGHEVQAAWTDDATLVMTISLPWAEMPGAATLAMYTNELMVHTWDLAMATGQSPAWDDDVLAVAFAAIQIGLPAEGRMAEFDAVRENMPEGHEGFFPPFAAAVVVADDAPLIDRLVAWNGRRPSWSA